ncbi:CoA transferase [Nocardia spumae]|uniref:CoA transferase n=1 Tax=Nocardia spumae TaxID=2887190 RepID=UPI0035581502
MSGPLGGVKIVESAGIGPGPFGGMLFADMGAEVLRVERVGASHDTWNVAARGGVARPGRDSAAILTELGYTTAEISELTTSGVIGQ